MSTEGRAAYAAAALARVPRLLQLLDRDPTSSSYGCFDRAWWHLRTADFPCGMSEEGALALALAATLPIPGSPWHQQARMLEWARAAIAFARRKSHADGSCDDYYPFERALGAAVFSLHALALAAELVGCTDEDRAFLARRARWVAAHGESGTLANHHAIAAAALAVAADVCVLPELRAAAQRKAAEVLALQHAEGWFTEYDGCDPGYTTVTVGFLAAYWKRTADASVLPALVRACDFLESVQQPDGTFGGEHGARNAHHLNPHGFELLAAQVPAARRIADRVLLACATGAVAENDDDRLVVHTPGPLLLAWRDFHERRVQAEALPLGQKYFSGAGFLVWRIQDKSLIAGLHKGGGFRVHVRNQLVANDSGVALVAQSGEVLVSHLRHDAQVSDDGAACLTTFAPVRREKLTPLKSALLRLFMLGPGRCARNMVRKILQRRVVATRGASPFTLQRSFRIEGADFVVRDVLRAANGAPALRSAACSVGQTSHYTAAAQPWSSAWLLPWTDLPDAPAALNAGRDHSFERRW